MIILVQRLFLVWEGEIFLSGVPEKKGKENGDSDELNNLPKITGW